MNSLRHNQVLIFPGANTSTKSKTAEAVVGLDESRAKIEKIYVDLMYCRGEAAMADMKFVTYLLDLACEALREALPSDDAGTAG